MEGFGRPSKELVEKFRTIPTAIVSDNMHRIFAGGTGLRPFHGDAVLCGSALTVRTRPGDNLMVHKALDIARPGDVIVVDASGDLTNAIIGEIMLNYAITRGVAGFVIDGAVRDSGAIAKSGLPVYARGVTHRGPYKDGPGEINVAIALDGMVIEPGDLILGDDDGLVAAPFDHAEAICAAAAAKQASEEEMLAAIRAGHGPDRAWVDETLKRLGCTFDAD